MSTSTYRIRHPELKKWGKLAEEQGWRIEPSGGGHIKWYPPEELARQRVGENWQRFYIVTSSTPSTARSLRTAIRSLRQAGLMSAAEWRAHKRENRIAPTREEEKMSSTWKCRHIGCPESFSTANRRDSHEELDCVYPSATSTTEHHAVGDVPPMSSTSRPAPQNRKGTPKRKADCPLCPPERPPMTLQNMGRHFASAHPDASYEGHARGEVYYTWKDDPGYSPTSTLSPPLPPDVDDDELVRQVTATSLREQLIELVFPDGIPADVGKLTAFTAWLAATDTFLAQING